MNKTIKNTTGLWTMNGKLVSVPENYNISDYFRGDGTYLGPDIHGVEPQFRDYIGYTVRISTEPSYYGSNVTAEQAEEIAGKLSEFAQREFPGVRTETHRDGSGSSATTGPNEDVVNEINEWIAENWTAAL